MMKKVKSEIFLLPSHLVVLLFKFSLSAQEKRKSCSSISIAQAQLPLCEEMGNKKMRLQRNILIVFLIACNLYTYSHLKCVNFCVVNLEKKVSFEQNKKETN